MTADRIQTILQHTEGPTVLDLGAVQHDAAKAQSNRWLHDHLVRTFNRVIGVDILAADVERLNAQGYEMVQADVERMQLGVTADTVVAGELIEHLSNPGAMLDRAREHLKPGGRIVLSTPNPWAIVHFRRLATGRMRVNDEHTAWYGPIVLEQLLERRGFKNVHVEGVGPSHSGLTGLAQRFGCEPFGETTWVAVATKA